MTSQNFAYWLQGFFELNPGVREIGPEQTDLIRRHLALVFKHEIDPSFGAQREALEAIHEGAGGVSGTARPEGELPELRLPPSTRDRRIMC